MSAPTVPAAAAAAAAPVEHRHNVQPPPPNYLELVDGKVKIIAVYNAKGGVAKTTSTFTIAEGLASSGLCVMMVDCDHQQNLTSWVLKHRLERTGFTREGLLKTSLFPATLSESLTGPFHSDWSGVCPAHIVDVAAYHNGGSLHLLPCDDDITFQEERIANAHILMSIPGCAGSAMLPGAPYHVMMATAQAYDIDVIVLDLSPAMTTFNRILVSIADDFIVPCFPDDKSIQGIETLSRRFATADKDAGFLAHAQGVRDFQVAQKWRLNKLPVLNPRCLGLLVTDCMAHDSKSANGRVLFAKRLDQASVAFRRGLGDKISLPFESEAEPFILARLPSFGDLHRMAQVVGIPAPFLTPDMVRALCTWREDVETEPLFEWRDSYAADLAVFGDVTRRLINKILDGLLVQNPMRPICASLRDRLLLARHATKFADRVDPLGPFIGGRAVLPARDIFHVPAAATRVDASSADTCTNSQRPAKRQRLPDPSESAALDLNADD